MAKQTRVWIVEFDSEAVIDLEDVRSRGDRKAVFNVVQKLKDLGPEARPIYARFGNRFVVLAVAAKKKNFDRAVVDARERLERHY